MTINISYHHKDEIARPPQRKKKVDYNTRNLKANYIITRVYLVTCRYYFFVLGSNQDA